MHHQHDVGDPSEQTRQAKGVMHAAGVMDPQHMVKTHLERNVIISRSTCETDISYLHFSQVLGIQGHEKGIDFRAHLQEPFSDLNVCSHHLGSLLNCRARFCGSGA